MPANEEEAFLKKYDIHRFDVPLTTVDVVVFSLLDEQLCVQLVRRDNHPFRGAWALPGGFINVHEDDDLDGTARRVLLTKTGASTPYLEQLGGFGNKGRDPRGWAATFVYFALIDLGETRGETFQGCWMPIVSSGVKLSVAFDHATLITHALERLRSKVSYSSLPVHLLPDQFTLSRCQRVFEIVLGHSLEKSAFRKRLRDAEVVEQVPGAFERGNNRPAALYKMREGKETVFFPGVLRGGKER